MAKGTTLKDELEFEKKNKDLVKLPKYARIKKRPIPHPPAASPYAGASVPKVVYVSTTTPFMSAAKRVQKLLRQAERRATAGVDITNSKRMSERERIERMTKSQENLKREAVFIKATGRAIEKALSVGRWFEEKEEEYAVRVKTGSVLVVDDIEEDEEAKRKEMAKQEREQQQRRQGQEEEKEGKEGKEEAGDVVTAGSMMESEEQPPSSKSASKKRKRRAKPTVSTDAELPETRTRWVNMVEIAVTLK
ncbi:hypothetical protein VTN00DRAFT_1686 [Thermoascus crustaceus]|uniref:uncharacterized protein n=1 Tax=Thermoascus crustaceus TaxID=5088 RepID=UPI003743C529